MTDAPCPLFCDGAFLAITLLIIGLTAYQLIQLTEQLIRKIKYLDHDLYRAILFPHRQSYEADVTGLSALICYPRFMKAILSGDFTRLNELRAAHNRIAAYGLSFVVGLLCLLAWATCCIAN